MKDRKCLQCFDQLKGRADQKFCSDQCRSAYNNSQYSGSAVVKTVNRILKKNYSILSTLYAAGKTTTSKGDLQKKGYCFDFFTCTFNSRRNNRINYFCYDQGYREQEANKIILLHHDLTDDLTLPRA